MCPLLSMAVQEIGYLSEPQPVLRNSNLTISPGELLLLVGSNGCGKSTLLRALAGDPHTRFKGRILFKGSEISPRASAWRRVGVVWVPQEQACFEELTVRDNLELAAHAMGSRTIGRALLIFPELERLLSRRAMYLSGGQRRMLEVSVSGLHSSPSLLLLDEPTAGLSTENSARFVAFIENALSCGTAVVVATHKNEFRQLKHGLVSFMQEAVFVCEGTETGKGGRDGAEHLCE